MFKAPYNAATNKTNPIIRNQSENFFLGFGVGRIVPPANSSGPTTLSFTVFSFIVTLVVIGGTIAIIAYILIGTDDQHVTDKKQTDGVTTNVEPPPSMPALAEPVPDAAEPMPEPETASAFTKLLISTRNPPISSRLPRFTKLIGSTVGMGFLIAGAMGVFGLILIITLRIFANV